jgi:exopolyphosphatase/guanosine-5'-triphosphate,3'-diphosphate pyrophosphatase
MARVAAIDCGTNSLRLLIADIDPETGETEDVDRRMEIVRLGEGVDRTGRLSEQALERTLKVARFYAALCEENEVGSIRFIATSASRDAENRDDFVAGIQEALGVDPEVISGAQEAELSFVGATMGLDPAHEPPFLVVDIGGGSTEFVLGDETADHALSVDVGCVRMTERHLRSDPPSHQEVLAAVADIDAAIERAALAVPFSKAGTLVGLAGSVTTVTAHALRLSEYDANLLQGTVLPVDDVKLACQDLLAMTRAQRGDLPYMHPGRVDVIGAGALIWRRIVERVAAEAGVERVVTSERDILDGIAWSIVAAG